MVSDFLAGAGITTSLISLIANAGPEDQAIATAGEYCVKPCLLQLTHSIVSYLFRSLGSVVGISMGSTIVQMSLRSTLIKRLSGQDVEEVRRSPGALVLSNSNLFTRLCDAFASLSATWRSSNLPRELSSEAPTRPLSSLLSGSAYLSRYCALSLRGSSSRNLCQVRNRAARTI